MTAQDRNTLKNKFKTGDVPQGSDYADMIDSSLNVVDPAEQNIVSTLRAPTLNAVKVSAGTLTVGGVSIGVVPVGQLYVSATATTVISTIGAFVPIAGTFSVTQANGFSAKVASGTWVYKGTLSRSLAIVANLSIAAQSDDQRLLVRIAKNGTGVAHSEIESAQPKMGQPTAFPVYVIVSADPQDEFGVVVANGTTTADVNVKKLLFSVAGT